MAFGFSAAQVALGGAVGGALLGGGGSGSQSSTQTASKEPWAPAQPYIKKNLENEAALQDYYRKTPFNQQQIEAYSNLFGDIGNFRNSIAPGLMDFANKGMTSSYQRQRGGAPGSVAGYGGSVQPGGLLQSGQGAFSVNRTPSLLDLNGAQNPFAKGAIPAESAASVAETTAPEMTPEEKMIQAMLKGGSLMDYYDKG